MCYRYWTVDFSVTISEINGSIQIVFIDTAIVLFMFMLSFTFVIECGLFEWKRICAVFLSFVSLSNINKTNNHLSSELNSLSTKYHDMWRWKSRSRFGTGTQIAGLNPNPPVLITGSPMAIHIENCPCYQHETFISAPRVLARGKISVEGWWKGQYEKGHVLIYLSHILPGQITCYCPSQACPDNWISNGNTHREKQMIKKRHRFASTQKDHTLSQMWKTT
jgi:hypothetical protein